ncbi:hypothetical protein RHGRI_025986 [Rhododendron griersonianum]|uniref:Uncharacterized protein n=1 Tax=Rhododendron griersonianum TaxID=479676 RepID=A0AAV6IX77_9ERIC|nr:hypothetical protein RHGRI_025986 [Rhododendron griersonianum]
MHQIQELCQEPESDHQWLMWTTLTICWMMMQLKSWCTLQKCRNRWLLMALLQRKAKGKRGRSRQGLKHVCNKYVIQPTVLVLHLSSVLLLRFLP